MCPLFPGQASAPLHESDGMFPLFPEQAYPPLHELEPTMGRLFSLQANRP
jgi:hypothetical protein